MQKNVVYVMQAIFGYVDAALTHERPLEELPSGEEHGPAVELMECSPDTLQPPSQQTLATYRSCANGAVASTTDYQAQKLAHHVGRLHVQVENSLSVLPGCRGCERPSSAGLHSDEPVEYRAALRKGRAVGVSRRHFERHCL
jgi:hypothetical protein